MDVLVDGAQVRAERDFHQALVEQLDLGQYYGWNLAALRDRLGTDVVRPVRVIWNESAVSRANLGEDTFSGIIRVLEQVAEQDRSWGLADRFEYVLQ